MWIWSSPTNCFPAVLARSSLAEMKRLKPEVPMILYTGLHEPPAGYREADLILVKGMTPPEFLAAIAKLVAKPQSTASEA